MDNTIYIESKNYDKWERLREAQKIFNQYNIKFNMFNNGIQWIVYHKDEELEYYPTTGRWRVKDNPSTKTQQTYLKGILEYMGYNVEILISK